MSLDLESSLRTINDSAANITFDFDISQVIDAFRYLRNACASNVNFQKAIVKNCKIIGNSKSILLKIAEDKKLNNTGAQYLAIGLQFLGNLIVNNKSNKILVWSECRELFEVFLKFESAKVQNCCLMILYNIFLDNPEILNTLPHPFENVIELALNDDTSEYALFILDLFIQDCKYLENFYDKLNIKCRLIVLEEIQQLIKQLHETVLKSNVIKLLSSQFTLKSDWILNNAQEYTDDLKVIEVIKTLDALVLFSSDDTKKYLKILQQETSLLINCLALLKAIHSLSKTNGNCFTIISKPSELVEFYDSTNENPVVGFKSNLIRIIGNMSWNNLENQNIIRELEGLQVILDCCIIDAKNPFITQWCILAIHNILEKNEENQQLIKTLSKKGEIDPKSLQEIGIA